MENTHKPPIQRADNDEQKAYFVKQIYHSFCFKYLQNIKNYSIKMLDKTVSLIYNKSCRKLYYAAMAQVVEHILGKDEVTGSNPVSSSKAPRTKRPWGIFMI